MVPFHAFNLVMFVANRAETFLSLVCFSYLIISEGSDSRGPAGVKAALHAPRSRSWSLDTGLPASAYNPSIRGMSE